MKLPLFLLVSIVAASDDTIRMIRGGGGGGVATADDVATQKNTHNFYEAAAQGDFEEIPNLIPGYCTNNTNTAPDCGECKVVGGKAKFCGNLDASTTFCGACGCGDDPCGDGYQCVQCHDIHDIACYNIDVGTAGTYKCIQTGPVFDTEHV